MKPIKKTSNIERPLPFTVACKIGIIGAVISLPYVLSGSHVKDVGGWFPFYMIFSTVVSIYCLLGLWSMRRWSLYLYSGLLLANQTILLSVGLWNPSSLIVSSIVVIFGVAYFHKMD